MKIRTATPLPQDEADRIAAKPEMAVIHSIERPSGEAGCIEIYGSEAHNWYDWRVIDGSGEVIRDTAIEGANWGTYSSETMAVSTALSFDDKYGDDFLTFGHQRRELVDDIINGSGKGAKA